MALSTRSKLRWALGLFITAPESAKPWSKHDGSRSQMYSKSDSPTWMRMRRLNNPSHLNLLHLRPCISCCPRLLKVDHANLRPHYIQQHPHNAQPSALTLHLTQPPHSRSSPPAAWCNPSSRPGSKRRSARAPADAAPQSTRTCPPCAHSKMSGSFRPSRAGKGRGLESRSFRRLGPQSTRRLAWP